MALGKSFNLYDATIFIFEVELIIPILPGCFLQADSLPSKPPAKPKNRAAHPFSSGSSQPRNPTGLQAESLPAEPPGKPEDLKCSLLISGRNKV